MQDLGKEQQSTLCYISAKAFSQWTQFEQAASNFERAINILSQFDNIDPRNNKRKIDIYYGYATMLKKQQKYTESKKAMDKVINTINTTRSNDHGKHKEYDENCYNWYAKLLSYDLGEYELAINYFMMAFNMNKSNVVSVINI